MNEFDPPKYTPEYAVAFADNVQPKPRLEPESEAPTVKVNWLERGRVIKVTEETLAEIARFAPPSIRVSDLDQLAQNGGSLYWNEKGDIRVSRPPQPKPKPARQARPHAMKQKALDLLAEGLTQQAVADTLGIPRTTISHWQRTQNAARHTPTDLSKYLQAAEAMAQGMKQAEVAELVGVTQQTVSNWFPTSDRKSRGPRGPNSLEKWLQAAELIAQGVSQEATAERVVVTSRTVFNWCQLPEFREAIEKNRSTNGGTNG